MKDFIVTCIMIRTKEQKLSGYYNYFFFFFTTWDSANLLLIGVICALKQLYTSQTAVGEPVCGLLHFLRHPLDSQGWTSLSPPPPTVDMGFPHCLEISNHLPTFKAKRDRCWAASLKAVRPTARPRWPLLGWLLRFTGAVGKDCTDTSAEEPLQESGSEKTHSHTFFTSNSSRFDV